jgi:thymidylate kinase
VKGSIFVFEGLDGAGKSTLSAAVAARLVEEGLQVALRSFPGREPGTIGEMVYRLHHCPATLGVRSISPTALQLLHVAAHLDAIERTIVPLVRSGFILLLDRYWWSTWAYGIGSKADKDALAGMIDLERSFWGDLLPEAIFLVERSASQPAELAAVAEAYAQLASRDPRTVRIDNSGSAEFSIRSILRIVAQRISPLHES